VAQDEERGKTAYDKCLDSHDEKHIPFADDFHPSGDIYQMIEDICH
jgi:hypothetical protein